MKKRVQRAFTSKELQSLLSNQPLSIRRKKAIAIAKNKEPYRAYLLLMNGAIEEYFGTSGTKQGYSKVTYYPVSNPEWHEYNYTITD